MVNTREMLRHAVATVAYRGGKAIRETPPDSLEGVRANKRGHKPLAEILSHMGDLFDWALTPARVRSPGTESGTGALGTDRPIDCSRFACPTSTRIWHPTRADEILLRERLLQGPHCRRVDPHRPARDAPASGGIPTATKLCEGRHRRRARRARTGGSRPRVDLGVDNPCKTRRKFTRECISAGSALSGDQRRNLTKS